MVPDLHKGSSPDLKGVSHGRKNAPDINPVMQHCINFREIYELADKFAGQKGVVELRAAIDHAVEEAIFALAENEEDREQVKWYARDSWKEYKERHADEIENEEFSWNECGDLRKRFRKPVTGDESPVDLMIALRGTSEAIGKVQSLGEASSMEEIIDALAQLKSHDPKDPNPHRGTLEIAGTLPFRLDPTGRFAAEEIIAAVDDEAKSELRAGLVALGKARGINFLLGECRDPHTYTPAEKKDFKKTHGEAVEAESAEMAGAGFYVPESFYVQPGEPWTRAVVIAFKPLGMLLEEGQSEIAVSREQFTEALKWYGENTLEIEDIENDPGFRITVDNLPETVLLIPAGKERPCSKAIQKTIAGANETDPFAALEAVKEKMGKEAWKANQLS